MELFRLTGEGYDLFLLESGSSFVADDGVDFLHSLDGLADGDVVGEDTAHPAFGDVVHIGCFSSILDDLLGLAFRADEENISAVHDDALQEIAGICDLVNGLGEVDDGNTVLGTVDELFHFGVPAFCLMTEMTSGFEQIFY